MLLHSTNSLLLPRVSRTSQLVTGHKHPIWFALSDLNSSGFKFDYEHKFIRNALSNQINGRQITMTTPFISSKSMGNLVNTPLPSDSVDPPYASCYVLSDDEEDITNRKGPLVCTTTLSCGSISWLASGQVAHARESLKIDPVYEVGELFELGIQLSYVLSLLGLLAAGTFFVIRQVLVRRELDLSAKELQEQVRSGDADATELFELGAVMLRRKVYPAATKFLLQAIEKWDGDDQDLAQVHNALGVSYVRDEKVEKGIAQFEKAVKIQPGYVTAWNNLGDAYEKKKELSAALNAFEEVLLFDPNNKIALPRRDALKEKVAMYKGVPFKSKQKQT